MIRGFWRLLLLGTILFGSLNFLTSPQVGATSIYNFGAATSPTKQVIHKIASSWPWYLTRASGLIAAITLVILMLSGIGLITGYTYRFLEPLAAWATHRALGIAFGVSVFIHIFVLLFDKFTPFRIADLLFPFFSGYKPVTIGGLHLGSLWVALGIISMYLVAAIVLSSIYWIDKKSKAWRLIHFLTYLVVISVFFHALQLGTDLASGSFRFLWILFAIIILGAVVTRLARVGTTKKTKL